jgi:hypothetical protein
MHWLLIALLVSLLGLLLAAAGMARHIWLQRAHLSGGEPAEVIETADERDLESKP